MELRRPCVIQPVKIGNELAQAWAWRRLEGRMRYHRPETAMGESGTGVRRGAAGKRALRASSIAHTYVQRSYVRQCSPKLRDARRHRSISRYRSSCW